MTWVDFIINIIAIIVALILTLSINIYFGVVPPSSNVIGFIVLNSIVMVILYFLSKFLNLSSIFLRLNGKYIFPFVDWYILFNILILFSSFSSVNNDNKKPVEHQKTIFKTEEENNTYRFSSIEGKILFLKGKGLSKKNIYEKLKNDTEFRVLVKNGDEKFNTILSLPTVKNLRVRN